MADNLYDLKLADDGDLYLSGPDENGTFDLELISGAESVLQSVSLALSILRNEYVFRPDYGVPLLSYDSDNGNFLLSRLSDDIKRNLITSVVTSVEGVSGIQNLSINNDATNRTMNITLDIKTDSGETVTLNHIEKG